MKLNCYGEAVQNCIIWGVCPEKSTIKSAVVKEKNRSFQLVASVELKLVSILRIASSTVEC